MKWKKNVIFLLSVIVCCIPLFLTFNRGINYFDEGYILEGARRIGAGEIPYRDFHFIYTPGVIFYLALFFRLFGQYIIVERLAAMLASIVGIVYLGLLILKLTKNNIFAFLSMFIYALWGPSHLNFLWPVMFVLPFLFVYLYLLCERHFFLAGIVAAFILLSKHNFGAAVLISFLCSFVFIRYQKRQIVMMSLGFICGISPFLIYLFVTRSFLPFVSDMNTYTIQEILVQKVFSVPFPLQPGKFFLYAFPGIASLFVGLGLIICKKNISFIFIPLTLLFFYLFGIFPTPDWTHLLPLLSFTGTFFAFIPSIFGNKHRFLSYFLMVCMIGAGIYSILTRNYYRWEAPFAKQTQCFSSERMKYMCIDGKNHAVISQTVAVIEKTAAKDNYIFSFYNDPIYYFLTQKNNPTPFIDFTVSIGKKEEQKVVYKLQKNNVKILITRFPPESSPSKIISEYIKRNYVSINGIYEFSVWRKKS